ncbi:50S ribosomal protein L30 [Nanobdella aerobiophila]|uniref:Large ribosomal subunit protein uL30 n=1 Tax=Nanobdella aerobiophila TaxID=2586965 RepID=A0A915SIU6_9ARCH|nr:50S ribosomal protein L30 [Nanobdella aerobiophila]BBL45887.1 50S ribosomal protein L30 [Nanobdella aerobiophila]
MEKIIVIRIRGTNKAKKEIKDTLYLLRLRRNNYAVILDKTDSIVNMVRKVEPWVAWGEIDRDTLKELLLNRGRIKGNKKLTEDYIKDKLKMSFDEFVEKLYNSEINMNDIQDIKPFFRLVPPKGGYKRKGIKFDYKHGGAYGYYGKDINILLKRML